MKIYTLVALKNGETRVSKTYDASEQELEALKELLENMGRMTYYKFDTDTSHVYFRPDTIAYIEIKKE